jgi:hypothetical protein
MYSTEVITPQHLARTAVIYIRQSTPHQALSHQESLRLQYALTERAQALGWAPETIEVVDSDVGHSAASTHQGYVQSTCNFSLLGFMHAFERVFLALKAPVVSSYPARIAQTV